MIRTKGKEIMFPFLQYLQIVLPSRVDNVRKGRDLFPRVGKESPGSNYSCRLHVHVHVHDYFDVSV